MYLDANASSRMRPEVSRVMQLGLLAHAAQNPSSLHAPGRAARAALRAAREEIIAALCPGITESVGLVFTSGGTESCNLMIRGWGDCGRFEESAEIIVSSIEHPAVLRAVDCLESAGATIRRVMPQENGIVAVSSVVAQLSELTKMVCLMAANNETGALQPVAELCSALRAQGYLGLVVSDVSQALAKSCICPGHLFSLGVDALAFSSHKLGGPHGIGAFMYRAEVLERFPLSAHVVGGSQERGLRAGTENVQAALGFAAALSTISQCFAEEHTRRLSLRRLLLDILSERLELLCLTPGVLGANVEESSLDNTLLLRFPGFRGDDLVAAFDLEGVFVSSGSACSSGKPEVSAVLRAMGLGVSEAREAVRLSLDWDATEKEVRQAAEAMIKVILRLRHAA